jgi:CheY-like chemotaxis protein
LGVFFLGIKIVGVIEERNAEFIAALKEKNDELFQSREEILELQKYKENFLANITHELRTPLNAIKGVSELLKLPNTKEETTELIDGLNKSSNHLLNMVNDILDFSKLKEGKLLLRHQPFHLKDTIHAACKLLKITASDKGLLFTVDTSNLPETAIGDESRLIQILVNIVGNSIKFTATGSVKVKCFAQYETEKICLVKIKIIDTGIGISKEKVDIIFDDYVQADENVAAKFGGTGLGLGITKRLVELHKGTIVCKSVLKEGTTFNISIQYEYSATRYQSTNVGTFKKIENKVLNIIVADDNKMNVLVAEKLIKKSLSKANVLVASNGKQVIELLEKNKHIDVVLMDMKMPEMDGIEASKLIRQSADYYQLPIIAMTAATSDAEIKQCLDAGMNDYLSKPFYKDELLSKIQNVLIDNKSTVPKAKEIAN